jgi:hypothetical protein
MISRRAARFQPIDRSANSISHQRRCTAQRLMVAPDHNDRLKMSSERLNAHERRDDGAVIAQSLSDGLTVLRDALFARIHHDVEQIIGMDSMLIPTSELRTGKETKLAIDLYLIAKSAAMAIDFEYVTGDTQWYVPWLLELRLGRCDEEEEREVANYLTSNDDEQRLQFTDVLLRVCPESRRTPLVLFRLFPLSARIVTAKAFSDQTRVEELHDRQVQLHPAIEDCRQCHGQPMDNGVICHECGNPVWKFRWLTGD